MPTRRSESLQKLRLFHSEIVYDITTCLKTAKSDDKENYSVSLLASPRFTAHSRYLVMAYTASCIVE